MVISEGPKLIHIGTLKLDIEVKKGRSYRWGHEKEK